MNSIYSIKVTKIKDRWHCRLLINGFPFHELACELRADVGLACRYLMRDMDKFYGGDRLTSIVRHRMWNRGKYPRQGYIGKIYPCYLTTTDGERLGTTMNVTHRD